MCVCVCLCVTFAAASSSGDNFTHSPSCHCCRHSQQYGIYKQLLQVHIYVIINIYYTHSTCITHHLFSQFFFKRHRLFLCTLEKPRKEAPSPYRYIHNYITKEYNYDEHTSSNYSCRFCSWGKSHFCILACIEIYSCITRTTTHSFSGKK